jgi:hypothetical protein
MSRAWGWIAISELRAIHNALIARHGGLEGVRDQGMGYCDPDAADLAAAYAVWDLSQSRVFRREQAYGLGRGARVPRG